MKKLWTVILVIFVLMIVMWVDIFALINKVENLEKVNEQQVVINNRLVREIEETKDQNRRYLDTCLGLLGSWKEGD